jgi:hypothetical protein
MGSVVSFRHSLKRGRVASGRQVNSFSIEVPANLAMRISDAAVWIPKSPQQMALDVLEAAFPMMGGAA